MKVDSFNIEFGYELLSAVPYAYEKHLAGELTETESGYDTAPLYYFSPKHVENDKPRSWFNTSEARLKGLPYTFIHRWERPDLIFPPYKEIYANTEYKWEKPTLCICNRYNVEWSKRPINYFDEQILDWLFSNLKKQYEIVYFAVDLPEELQDNAHSMPLNDVEICRKHGIKVFQEIKCDSWNESLLKVFANCKHYITMNGGYSIMASFFGGQNIAYSKRAADVHAKELDFNEFFRYYPNHSNQQVIGVETYDELKSKVQALYIDNLPTANVIVRTSKRPNYFARCYKSIMQQDYPNINIVVTTDEPEAVRYTRPAKARLLQMPVIEKEEHPNSDDYGMYFPFNKYLEIAQSKVKGYVLFLDDDDMFNATNAVTEVMRVMREDALCIWRVYCGAGLTVPNGSFGKEVKLRDVSGIGTCYHTKHNHLTDWGKWKYGDYRTIRNLNNNLDTIWLDAVLTRRQTGAGMGRRIDINQPKIGYMKTVKILHPSAGKVGSVKRLDNAIAAKVVEAGLATYIKDVVEELNHVKPRQVIEKPKAEENKQLQIEVETKEVNPKVRRTRKSTKK